VWSYTDPRGNTTTSVYDYQEGAIDTPFQELLDGWKINQAPLAGRTGLGDPNGNGDGVSNQRIGRKVRATAPTLVASSLTTQKYTTSQQQGITKYAYNSKGQPISEIDPAGAVTTYQYYSGPDPHQGALTSSPGGYLGRVSADAFGVNLVTDYGYDALGRELWTKNPRGACNVRVYSVTNRVVDEIEGNVNTAGAPLGTDYRRTQSDFDLNEDLVERREYINTSVAPEMAYTGANTGWVTSRFGYDALDQVHAAATERFDPLLGGTPTWSIAWFHPDGRGKTTKEVSPAGRAVCYDYDSLGRIRRKRRCATLDTSPASPVPPSTTPADSVLQFVEDANGNLTTATLLGDSVSHVYSIAYDGFDRRVTLLDPEGTQTTLTLDPADNIARIQIDGKRMAGDAGIGTLRDVMYIWDERNRLSATISQFFLWEHHGGTLQLVDLQGGMALGSATEQYAYDSRDLQTFFLNDLGREIETQYDGVGRAIRRYSPFVAGFTNRSYVDTVYDGNGNVVQTVDHSYGKQGTSEVQDTMTITSTYDGLDRKIEDRRQPGATLPVVTTYGWSSLGDMIKTINPNSIGTRKKFDTLHHEVVTEFGWNSSFSTGQIVDATYNADGLVRSERTFDDEGKLLLQRDDSSQPTTWSYDAIGRLTTTTQADLSKESIAYDRSGSIASETRTFNQSGTDVLFSSVAYQYDLALRKTRADFTLNQGVTGLSGVYLELFGYDGLGRPSYGYTEAYVLNSTDIHKTTLDAEYDSFDNRWCDDQNFIIDHPSSPDVSFPTCVESEFDSAGNRLSVSTTGYVRTYAFDELNRINEIRDGTNALLHSFTWIGPGTRLNKQTNLNGTATTIGFAGYDVQRRLSQIAHANGGSTIAQFNYTYDQIGNELKEIKTHLPSNSQRLTYDAGNRLTKFEVGNNTSGTWSEVQRFNLDGVGNWRKHKISGTTYTNPVNTVSNYDSGFDSSTTSYDGRSNLRQIGSKSYTYDARGRLVAANIGGGPRQDYVYDAQGRRLAAEGWNSVYEGDREIQQTNINSPSQTRTYTYGVGLDDVLSYETTGTRYFTHKNRNGSTIALTTAAGVVAERYDYTPYGVATMTDVDGGGLVRIPYLFGGRRWDQVTNLYFMRARYYAPDMGRFASRDPIGFWGDAANSGNPFAYGSNNPLSGSDPFGLLFRSDGLSDWSGRALEMFIDAEKSFTKFINALDYDAQGTLGDLGTSLKVSAMDAALAAAVTTNSTINAFKSGDTQQAWENIADYSFGLANGASFNSGTKLVEIFAGPGAVEWTKTNPAWNAGTFVGAAGMSAAQLASRAMALRSVLERRFPGRTNSAAALGRKLEGASAPAPSAPKIDTPSTPGEGAGRGGTRLRPDSDAVGSHSTFKTNADGRITGSAQWEPNPKNPTGFDQVKRTDTQYANPHSHVNKVTGEDVPTPHVHEKSTPGGVRPAKADELPNGGNK